MRPALYFLIPGELDTLTGGYAYNRELIRRLPSLGFALTTILLSARFPTPDLHALNQAHEQLAAMPDGALVIIDGLAYGVMDEIAAEHHLRLRIIALCHHPLALETGLSPAQQTQLLHSEKSALQYARAVLVTSHATATLLQQHFDVAADKIRVALPGTHRQDFAPCRGELPRLLSVGSLIPRKGHDVLIKALARIRDLDWQARLVGSEQLDAAWAAELRALSHQHDIAQRICFAGSIAELSAEYQAADLFVLPSRFEGYGMVFAEALSHGLPVVAAHAGAVPDVVPASAGVLVAPDDVDALAQALRTLLSEPRRYQQLRHGAQQAATTLPDWDQTAGAVAHLLTTLY